MEAEAKVEGPVRVANPGSVYHGKAGRVAGPGYVPGAVMVLLHGYKKPKQFGEDELLPIRFAAANVEGD